MPTSKVAPFPAIVGKGGDGSQKELVNSFNLPNMGFFPAANGQGEQPDIITKNGFRCFVKK